MPRSVRIRKAGLEGRMEWIYPQAGKAGSRISIPSQCTKQANDVAKILFILFLGWVVRNCHDNVE